MNPQEQVQSFYQDLLARYPQDDLASVHFSHADSQVIRLIVLTQIAQLEDCKVLDFGCGHGPLYRLLTSKHPNIEYLGVDLVPEMIQSAQTHYPQAHFIAGELTALEIQEGTFDYSLCSGVFNYRLKDQSNHDYLKNYLQELLRVSRKGVAFNFTTQGDEVVYNFDPWKVYQLCRQLCSRAVLRQDYLENDATIYLYK